MQRGVKIVIYHYVSPSGFSEPEEIYLPKDYDLEKTVVNIGQEFSENIYSTKIVHSVWYVQDEFRDPQKRMYFFIKDNKVESYSIDAGYE